MRQPVQPSLDSDLINYPFEQQMEERSSASSDDPRYKFTEKERDAESGYDYFGVSIVIE